MYPLRNRTLDRMRGTGLKSADAWMEAFNPTIAGISGSILQILSQRWHPIQDLLTQLGIKMKELWVDIVEEIAKAVSRSSSAKGSLMRYRKVPANGGGRTASHQLKAFVVPH
jgi:hypothetical protein